MYAIIPFYESFSSIEEHFSDIVEVYGILPSNAGLGNQLFIIFTTMAYAFRQGKTPIFDNTVRSGTRPTYWNTLLSETQSYLRDPTTIHSISIYTEKEHSYRMIPEGMDQLSGYFQSEMYFIDCYHMIYNTLQFEKKRMQVKQKMPFEKYSSVPNISVFIFD
jgi:hypothetical protein